MNIRARASYGAAVKKMGGQGKDKRATGNRFRGGEMDAEKRATVAGEGWSGWRLTGYMYDTACEARPVNARKRVATPRRRAKDGDDARGGETRKKGIIA
jgi:hypothetical protein